MKSRSEAKKAKDKQKAETEADHAVEREAIREEATTPAEKKAAAETGGKPNGLFCEKCLEPQVDTPSGATCANRHGGADGLTAKEAKAVRAQREKNAAEDAAKEEPETDDEEEEDDEDEPAASGPRVPRNPFVWPNANRGKESAPREDLVRVVETVFVDDIHEEWKALQKALELGDKRTEHAHVIRALDKAARNADRAFRLYLTAKQAREKWEAENEPVWAAMWSEATKSLQSEKESGQRAKQITDADVKARVATLYPDQYRDQEDRRRAIEFTVKSLERLADIWFKKISNLETHVAKLRG